MIRYKGIYHRIYLARKIIITDLNVTKEGLDEKIIVYPSNGMLHNRIAEQWHRKMVPEKFYDKYPLVKLSMY